MYSLCNKQAAIAAFGCVKTITASVQMQQK
jgi:hypothetical protein